MKKINLVWGFLLLFCFVLVRIRTSSAEKVACPVDPYYMPVCGSDENTYSHPSAFECAQMERKDLSLKHYGRCGIL